MEDLEKYIFDPRNPQKCKVYKLLLNIMKRNDHVAFVSPFYFFRIFEKRFDFIKDELWDLPEAFDFLDIVEKVKLYIEQYSILDLIKRIKIEDDNFDKLFPSILGVLGRPDALFQINDKIKNIDFETFFQFINEDWANCSYGDFSGRKKNFVFFTKSLTIPNIIQPEMASVLIMSRDDYLLEREMDPLAVENSLENVSPLLLDAPEDVNLLLEILQRDLQVGRKALVDKTIRYVPFLAEFNAVNYFSLENIEIDAMENKKEIYILGENGDGKTLLLQAIMLAFKGNEEIGLITDYIKHVKNDIVIEGTDSAGRRYIFSWVEREDDGMYNLLAYGVNRHLNDSDRKETHGYLTLFDADQYLGNPTKWLQYLDYKASKGDETEISLEVAKEMLRDILDQNVDIDVTPDRVIFSERGTEVSFDRLSDGYKSVVIWVCDMVERLSKNQPHVTQLRDLQGVVLVDEIDLHLHPKWQYQIVRKLRGWFPNIQFIFTTHSPTVILGSSEGAVFYKLYKEDGVVRISKPLESVKNQMANTVLTSPLFDLEQASAAGSDPDKVDTSDGFVYSLIHREIARRIRETKGVTESDILDMVIEELDRYESEHDQGE